MDLWLPGEQIYALHAPRSWRQGLSQVRWAELRDQLIDSPDDNRDMKAFLKDREPVGVINVYAQGERAITIRTMPAREEILHRIGYLPALGTDTCPISGIGHLAVAVKEEEKIADLQERRTLAIEMYRRRDGTIETWIETFTTLRFRELHTLLETIELIMTLF